MKIYNIDKARTRRHKILASTSKLLPTKKRLESALRKATYVFRNTKNPITKLKAKKDMRHFRKRLMS